MINPHRKDNYQHKIMAIVQLAKHWQGIIGKQKEWSELAHLLATFSEFSEGYISLLEKIPAEIAYPQFALNRGMDKLLNEWNALSRACEQRLVNDQEGGLPRNIKAARKNLQAYCDSWNGSRVSKPYLKLTQPVVYFEKVYRLSRSVYAPSHPLLSIPLIDFIPNDPLSKGNLNDLRWPALAHEFGHHIFWNALDLEHTHMMQKGMLEAVSNALLESTHSKKNSTGFEQIQLTGQVVEKIRIWAQWLEEVFADVCGTLLEGLAYARSAQDIAIEKTRTVDSLISSDHEHPSPYLRPLIALEVLYKIANFNQSNNFQYDLNQEVTRLKEHWLKRCGDIGQKMYPNSTLTMQDLQKDISPIVDVILMNKYWPRTTKTLKSRLEAYNQRIILAELKAPTPLGSPIPLPESEEQSEGVIAQVSNKLSSPSNTELPEALESIWIQLKSGIDTSSLNTQQEALAHWYLLLGLNLSDDHFHSTNHACKWHLIYMRCHTHDVNSGAPIPGCSC